MSAKRRDARNGITDKIQFPITRVVAAGTVQRNDHVKWNVHPGPWRPRPKLTTCRFLVPVRRLLSLRQPFRLTSRTKQTSSQIIHPQPGPKDLDYTSAEISSSSARAQQPSRWWLPANDRQGRACHHAASGRHPTSFRVRPSTMSQPSCANPAESLGLPTSSAGAKRHNGPVLFTTRPRRKPEKVREQLLGMGPQGTSGPTMTSRSTSTPSLQAVGQAPVCLVPDSGPVRSRQIGQGRRRSLDQIEVVHRLTAFRLKSGETLEANHYLGHRPELQIHERHRSKHPMASRSDAEDF